MITWKALKYKHTLRAQEIAAGQAAGTVTEKEFIEFVISLVAAWDFVDEETGQVVPLADYGELSIAQFNELAADFNRQMAGTGLKKTNSVKSSSGLTPSKPAKTNSPKRRPGLIPSL